MQPEALVVIRAFDKDSSQKTFCTQIDTIKKLTTILVLLVTVKKETLADTIRLATFTSKKAKTLQQEMSTSLVHNVTEFFFIL